MQSIPGNLPNPWKLLNWQHYMVSENSVYNAGQTFALNEGLMDNIGEGA